jgi:hypothetical protein
VQAYFRAAEVMPEPKLKLSSPPLPAVTCIIASSINFIVFDLTPASVQAYFRAAEVMPEPKLKSSSPQPAVT